ncbi:Transcription-repair-coupling factor [Pontivivens insulae]|uniref:Transcription-repair-coupling factor n=1 Tax=Pontivivens insulae TaxID=1639689 RepID=A0A2R8ABA1_9RHOB|nr:transcription-repair coupling factor [Pontivivens insulae]RED13266.1 transcription-repair coupling factor [Pontivivens insulae]SPF29358.1 Transcription-repair-coupling factor [Pontivivens insulae]
MSIGTVKVGGAPEGYDARLVADYVRAETGPLIHVARDDTRMAAMEASLRFLAPEIPVLQFPAWDCLPYDRISPNADVAARRMATLAALADGFDRPAVILTTVNAATQRVPARETMRDASFTAIMGRRLDEERLRKWLIRMGFSQTPMVTEPGDYSIRGGLIDIYPPGPAGPVRLDLFGDELDRARRFDAQTQRTKEEVARVELAPVSEVILDEDSIERFRKTYRETFGQPGPEDALYESVSAGRKHQGYEHWAPFFHQRMETLFDYLPYAPVTMDDQSDAVRDARWDTVLDHYRARADVLKEKGRRDGAYKPVPPSQLYLDDAAWDTAIGARAVRKFSPNPTPSGPGVVDAGGRIGRNFAQERQAEDLSLFGALADHVEKRRKSGAVLIASYSQGSRDRMSTLMSDSGTAGAEEITRFSEVGGKGALALAIWPLDSGFEAPGLTVIAEQDVLGDRLVRRGRRKKRADNFLTEATSLAPGDLVVHVEHGVGRYHGLETITVTGAPHECLSLEYADNARLYLPVENIELLTRFGHEEGLLDRLGGGAWQAKKAKLKEKIKLAAERLIRVAAERELRKAPILTPPEGLWDEFCARFPYQETEDQLSAIEDVLDDMGAGKPMDRLVCGDVGFGKTEVALRAAFVAAMSGVQVAVIAPTTLLARQHYRAFAERFKGLPVKVRPMSRFVSTKEMAQTREGLARNEVEIVVGTHAVLAKNMKFANLGLLIIDEEQHFGVAHKERLKELRSDIHVLTMTATPIPRTLQLSLSGVRELSIIGTPPVDRLAIRTYVSEFDPLTVREALLREKYRGGQAFYVVPRVSDLEEIERFLKDEVPEVSFITAHGQLAAGDLDERMNAFYDGQYDVLLATTIVESGIDIPAANTLIVHRADMFGLSQLYQIRGRVGRSKIRAYAYLTTKKRKKLTPAAEKRLRVLGSLDSLGAGFALASQDLDIRGAGNLLGEEQSGQIKEVGYALYQDMLEEAINKLRSGEGEGLSDDGQWSPQINLGVPVMIPEPYVPDLDVRLGLYRRLSTLEKKVELEGFAAELIDRFGPLPAEVDTLMKVVRIKAMCRKANIGRIDAGPKGATVQFHQNRYTRPEGLVQFLQDQNGRAKIKDNKVIVARNWPDEAARIRGSFAIARDLARLAKA